MISRDLHQNRLKVSETQSRWVPKTGIGSMTSSQLKKIVTFGSSDYYHIFEELFQNQMLYESSFLPEFQQIELSSNIAVKKMRDVFEYILQLPDRAQKELDKRALEVATIDKETTSRQ